MRHRRPSAASDSRLRPRATTAPPASVTPTPAEPDRHNSHAYSKAARQRYDRDDQAALASDMPGMMAAGRPGYLAPMAVTNVFTSMPVRDIEAAVAWYARFVGRAPDMIPNDGEAAWRLTDTAWIYVVADPGRAGSAYCTILLDDIDGFVRSLAGHGIASDPVETMADVGVRRTVVNDPDGNRIQLGQPPS